MTTQPTNQPVQTLRDGTLSAAIWRNTSEKGTFYSVTINRRYKDAQGNYHDSDSYSGSELLRIARLAQICYDEITIHRAEDREAAAA